MRVSFWHIVTIFAILLTPSCKFAPGEFGVEEIVSVESSDPQSVWVEVVVRNDSDQSITLQSGEITMRLKRDKLITLQLIEPTTIAPVGATKIKTQWSMRTDDPTTLYSMRRHPITRYADRLTLDFRLTMERNGGLRTLSHRGLKWADIDMNFENLLR